MHDAWVTPQRIAIGELAGSRPPTCPWRCLEDPLVRDVLSLYGAREMTDPVLMAGGDEAPCRVVEGLLAFDQAMRAFRADERKRAEEERQRERKQLDQHRKR